jgi:hypothetical protein
MPVTIVVPQLGESVVEGTIGKWLKKVGDPIAKDEPIVEIITDKINIELPAPSAGTLGPIAVPEGAVAQVPPRRQLRLPLRREDPRRRLPRSPPLPLRPPRGNLPRRARPPWPARRWLRVPTLDRSTE